VFLAPAAVLVAVALLRRAPPYRRRVLLLDGMALAVAAAVAWWALQAPPRWNPPRGLRVTMLDVGQGDGILLEVPEGAVLVDAGPPEARVERRLRAMGLRSLAALVVSHPHRDHVGGATSVLTGLDVAALLDPLQPGEWPEDAEARRAAVARGTVVVPARAAGDYRLGRLRIRVLWPDEAGAAGEDPHEHGVVLLASYGATDLLLTGDAESPVTRRLPLRRIEVLKVAHHGSEDPGLAEQLRLLRPRLALISVGRGNGYGHPREETIAALRSVPGLTVHRTDELGEIVVESDGRAISVRSGSG
jgi:competence protein ComEC